MADPKIEPKFDPSAPIDLPNEVKRLRIGVIALQRTLEDDYPTRREVRTRRYQIVFAVIIAIIASYFFTIGTVSYCFLQGIPQPGEQQFCKIFPGWEESFNNNRVAQQSYLDLIERTEKNAARIEELERQLEAK